MSAMTSPITSLTIDCLLHRLFVVASTDMFQLIKGYIHKRYM